MGGNDGTGRNRGDTSIGVSILIPVHNKAKYLDECLGSVFSQTGVHFEVVCVDDGSTDESPDILTRWAREEHRLTVVRQECGGPSSARNTALEHARGAYILFVDADDTLEPDMLERVFAEACSRDAQVVVFGWSEWHAETGALVPHPAGGGQVWNGCFSLKTILQPSLSIFTPSVWTKLFQRSYLEERHLRFHEDIRVSEDLAFTYETLAFADRIVVIPDPLYRYRQNVTASLVSQGYAPHCLAALDHIASYGNGIYCSDPALRRHFVNLVLDTAHYALNVAKTGKEFDTLYEEIRQRWLPFAKTNSNDIGNEQRPFFEHVCKMSALDFLVAQSAELRGYVDVVYSRLSVLEQERPIFVQRDCDLSQRCADLERQLDEMRRDERAVRGSWAFRVGRAITWIPSRLRAALGGSAKEDGR